MNRLSRAAVLLLAQHVVLVSTAVAFVGTDTVDGEIVGDHWPALGGLPGLHQPRLIRHQVWSTCLLTRCLSRCAATGRGSPGRLVYRLRWS